MILEIVKQLGVGLGTGVGDWGWGLGLGTVIGDWDWGLGLWTGIVDWDWGQGLGTREWENGKWEIESTPVPGDDSIMPRATLPTTFNHKGGL